MKRLLALLLPLSVFTGCLEVDQVIDLGATPKTQYLKVSWAENGQDRGRTETALARVMAMAPSNFAPFTLKRLSGDERRGLEWTGPLSGADASLSGTPLAPAIRGNTIDISLALPPVFTENLSGRDAWMRAAAGGSSYRLMIRTPETRARATLLSGGTRTPLKVTVLRDLVLVDAPLPLFLSAYKRVTVRVDLGETNVLAMPDTAERRIGEDFVTGVKAFDDGEMITAHGAFARLFHEVRLADGDLYLFYGITSMAVDRDPAQARNLYLLAIDWFKTGESRMPWEEGRDKAYFMLGLLYSDAGVSFKSRDMAKKTFDAGLAVNPKNRYILGAYERVTGTKAP